MPLALRMITLACAAKLVRAKLIGIPGSNIELGVLIRDRALALTIGGYFQNLIDRGLLKPLPLT